MKANELCVGDWVQTRACTIQGEERLSPPMRVVAVGEAWVQVGINPESVDPDEYDIEDIRLVCLKSDLKVDRRLAEATESYKADIEKYKREIEELKQRLAIAEKVIADKNKETRK